VITYRENRNNITQIVEFDLTKVTDQSRQVLEHGITEYLKHVEDKHKKIFKFEVGNKLVYETEVLIPKVNKNRLNVLMVLGNPAVHSVAERMFFSYERRRNRENQETWIEHRFWRALRDCDVLEFNKNVKNPTPQNIDEINSYKRDCLLNGDYISDFNIFLLPYFSFPTPASGPYSGVNGIKKIVGEEIFEEMKKFEFQRFKGIFLGNNIKNVTCFQKTAGNEVIEKAQGKPIDSILNNRVYKLGDALKHVTLYTAPPTRLLHTNSGKKILKSIVADIKAKNKID